MVTETAAASDLPDPLVPAHIDIRGMSGFMLDVDRLLASELVALGSPEECWHAFMLWCRAWQQHPAASLPNDDRVLAAFSKAGTRWKKVRAVSMRGFVLCSDGRFYHRVLAEQVVTAWNKRQAYRNDQERLKKWRGDRKASGVNSSGWESLRVMVFERDGNKCTDCGKQDGLHCDHITPLAVGGSSEMSNLTTLCRACHSRKTATSDMPMKSKRNGHEMHFNGSSEAISERDRQGEDRDRDRDREKNSKLAARAKDGVVPEPSNGRPTVNGHYLDWTFGKACEAACMPDGTDDRPVIAWLRDGLDPDVILSAIRRCSERPNYQPPRSLAWFDAAVREQQRAAA